MTNVGIVTADQRSDGNGAPCIVPSMIIASYTSVCATASTLGQKGCARIPATTSAGMREPLVMNVSAASPLRPDAIISFNWSTISSGTGVRLSSTTNGG